MSVCKADETEPTELRRTEPVLTLKRAVFEKVERLEKMRAKEYK
jgi:hypothetical protein